MIDNDAALDAVIRHANQDDDLDPGDVGPLLATLSGDVALLPRVRAALDVFLDEGNFYGRDLMAELLAEAARRRHRHRPVATGAAADGLRPGPPRPRRAGGAGQWRAGAAG